MRVRIGIHSGEAAAAGERYVGFSVHRAARIGAVGARRSGAAVSDATRVAGRGRPADGRVPARPGLVRLKDVDRPERISQVAAEGLQAEFPPLRGAERVKSQPVLRRRSAAGGRARRCGRGGGRDPGVRAHQRRLGLGAAASPVLPPTRSACSTPATGSSLRRAPVGTAPSSIAAGGARSGWRTPTTTRSPGSTRGRTRSCRRSRSATRRPGSPSAAALSGSRTASAGRSRRSTRARTAPVSDDPGRQRAERGRLRAGGVWVANSSRPDGGADRPAHGDGRAADSGRRRRGRDRRRGRRGLGDERVGGSVARIDPRTERTAADQRRQRAERGRGRCRGGLGREQPRRHRVADRPGYEPRRSEIRSATGRAVSRRAGGVVWVSNELGGTLSRIDPAAGQGRPDRRDWQPARRGRGERGQAVRRRADVGPRPSRRHADRRSTARHARPRSTRRSRTTSTAGAADPDQRRPRRLQARRRQRRLSARARPRHVASRRRPTAAGRTRSSFAPASATRPGRSCDPRTSAARSSGRSPTAGTGASTSRDRRRHGVQDAKRCDLYAGDRSRPGREHDHLPPDRSRSGLPLQARAAVRLRRAGEHAR